MRQPRPHARQLRSAGAFAHHQVGHSPPTAPQRHSLLAHWLGAMVAMPGTHAVHTPFGGVSVLQTSEPGWQLGTMHAVEVAGDQQQGEGVKPDTCPDCCGSREGGTVFAGICQWSHNRHLPLSGAWEGTLRTAASAVCTHMRAGTFHSRGSHPLERVRTKGTPSHCR